MKGEVTNIKEYKRKKTKREVTDIKEMIECIWREEKTWKESRS